MPQPESFTVEALNQQLRANVVRVLYHSFNSSHRQVTVQGQMGEIRPTPYRLHYGVKLKGDTGQTLYLDIEKEAVARNKIETGDYVEVIGVLSVDDSQNQSSKVDIRISVSAIAKVGYPQVFERQERATIEFLKALDYHRSELPDSDHPLISVVHPLSEKARVQDDFQLQLSQVRHLLELELISVPMTRTNAVAEAIARAAGDVVVLIRGGGDPSDFEVFDHKAVVEAWASKKAYKALGLGHEGTGSTLLDFISDFVGSTPTAVGAFLCRGIAAMHQRRRDLEALRSRCQKLDEEKCAVALQLSRADETRGRALQQRAEAAKRTRDRLLIAAALVSGFCFALGVILGLWFARHR